MLDLFTSADLLAKLNNVELIQPPAILSQTNSQKNWFLPTDTKAAKSLDTYLKTLSGKGFNLEVQGIWLQTGDKFLASHAGSTPHSAASVTKVATSLVALKRLGPGYEFQTQVATTGAIVNGVLSGDLVIQGGGDPLFVWEEAISVGNALNRMGIRKVTGNLVIAGNFAMNFETDPQKAGLLLRQAFDPGNWPLEAAEQFAKMSKNTPRPQIIFAGQVFATPTPPPSLTPLLVRRSLPMVDIIHQMNVHSNNVIADQLAAAAGGFTVVAQESARLAGVPAQELQLINGSGLGPENRISPRAACGLFQAMERLAKSYNLGIADFFPMKGQDLGTVEDRVMPRSSVVKTGTLWNVSALAGAIPTRDHGTVWFAIMNEGEGLEWFRAEQDKFLQELSREWGTPAISTPEFVRRRVFGRFGDDRRNKILRKL